MDSKSKILENNEKMKVLVTSSSQSLNGPIDPRFGRCPFFLVFELPSHTPHVIPNQSEKVMHRIGITVAQKICLQGIKTVITGNIGPNAFQVLSSAGIQVFTTSPTSVKKALEKFERNELILLDAPSGPSHMGVGEENGHRMGSVSRRRSEKQSKKKL
ncbi:MAG: NifB/NifX family molybdenum-iron cluster-binding protein [Promethearchaeota archaeon]